MVVSRAHDVRLQSPMQMVYPRAMAGDSGTSFLAVVSDVGQLAPSALVASRDNILPAGVMYVAGSPPTYVQNCNSQPSVQPQQPDRPVYQYSSSSRPRSL